MELVLRKLLLKISKIGISITSTRNLNYLNKAVEDYVRYKTFVYKSLHIGITSDEFTKMHDLYSDSKSQLFQDLYVLNHFNYKLNGYFVEIGAADGITFSNTWILETKYGWNGILVEPSKNWHKELYKNRIAKIDSRAVWEKSGSQQEFTETVFPELSGLTAKLSKEVKPSSIYNVETVSLEELLEKYNAPVFIDYLSIDTEGSEIDILRSFNFNRYKFGFISVEHNFRDDRNRIHDVLTKNGYKHFKPEISEFDDWYIS